jgi:hypothetical protein
MKEITDDADSALGADAASSTASLATSILEYRTVHGRTYHSDRVTDHQYWYVVLHAIPILTRD